MVVNRQPISVFDGEKLFLRKALRRSVEIEAGYLLFGQITCRLQESNVESREAVVVAGNSEANQLDQFGGD